MRSNALRQTRSYTSGIGYTVLLLIITVALLLVSCSGIAGAESFRPPIVVPSVSGPVVAPPGPTGVVHSDGTSVLSETPVNMSEINLESLSYVSSTVTVVSGPPAFLSGWSYRKIHAIGGSPDGDLTNYQMRFVVWRTTGTDSGENVYVGTNVREDYGDLRFTTVAGAQIPYWIESVNATAAVVWTKVPSIPRAGTQVFVYYGNPSASSASNGKATFEVFDDFESGVLDTSLWQNTGGYGISTASGKGVIQKTASTGHGSSAYMYTPYSGVDGTVVISVRNSNTLDRRGGPMFRASDGRSPTLYADPVNGAHMAITTNGVWGGALASAAYSIPNEAWYTYEITKSGNQFTGTVKSGQNLVTTVSAVQSVSPTTIGIHFYDTATAIDYIYFRKTATVEPTHGEWGSTDEPQVPPTPNFTGSPLSGLSPLTVQFTATSSGRVTDWQWNFGDGTENSTLQNPSHTYHTTGTYSVTLTATNVYGSGTAVKTNYITVSEPPDFITGYAYRKMHTITATEALTDYPVQFRVVRGTGTDSGNTVYVGDSVQANFADVRFTDFTGQILPYWIESYSEQAANIWVKVPAIPRAGTQVFVYYGNPSASSASNGKATFEVFDDFESGVLDTSLWQNTGGYGISTASGKGVIQKTASTGHGSSAYMYTPYSGVDGTVVISVRNSNTLDRRGGPMFRASDGRSPTLYADPVNGAHMAITTNGVWGGALASAAYSIPNEAWYTYEITKNGNQFTGTVKSGQNLVTTVSAVQSVSPTTIGIHFYDTATAIDYIYFRKTATVEPTHGEYKII